MKKRYRVTDALRGILTRFREDQPSELTRRVLQQMYWGMTLSIEQRRKDFNRLITQNTKRL
ncbi:MAG TPA: hypothetical protein DCR93_20630 [Cytophagales bacterium]|nr:hypothetical protein [Cytophagales bacterium]